MVGTPLTVGRELAHLFCFPVCSSGPQPIMTLNISGTGGPSSPTGSWSAQWALSMTREVTVQLPCTAAASVVLEERPGPSLRRGEMDPCLWAGRPSPPAAGTLVPLAGAVPASCTAATE